MLNIENLLEKHFYYYDTSDIYPSSDKNKRQILEIETYLVSTGYCISFPPETFSSRHLFELTEKGEAFIDGLRVKWLETDLNSLSIEARILFDDFLKNGNDAIDTDSDEHENELDELELAGLLTETCEESYDNWWTFYELTEKGIFSKKRGY